MRFIRPPPATWGLRPGDRQSDPVRAAWESDSCWTSLPEELWAGELLANGERAPTAEFGHSGTTSLPVELRPGEVTHAAPHYRCLQPVCF
eukprot:COSAG06_NODE_35_length_30757_cov_53.112532_18_plen_90_part_00